MLCCHVVCCLVLSCVALSLVLYCLLLSCLGLRCIIWSCGMLCRVVFPCLVLSSLACVVFVLLVTSWIILFCLRYVFIVVLSFPGLCLIFALFWFNRLLRYLLPTEPDANFNAGKVTSCLLLCLYFCLGLVFVVPLFYPSPVFSCLSSCLALCV